MRKLATRDVFSCARLMRSIGTDKVKTVFELMKDTEKETEDRGISILLAIADCLSESGCEKQAYAFIGSLFEMEPDGVADLPIDELLEKFKELGEANSLIGFFTSAAKSTGAIG